MYSAGVSIFGYTDKQAYLKTCKERGFESGYPKDIKKINKKFIRKIGTRDRIKVPYNGTDGKEGCGLELFDAIDTLSSVDKRYEVVFDKLQSLFAGMTKHKATERFNARESLNELKSINLKFQAVADVNKQDIGALESKLEEKFGDISERSAQVLSMGESGVNGELQSIPFKDGENLLQAIVDKYSDDYIAAIEPVIGGINSHDTAYDLLLLKDQEVESSDKYPLVKAVLQHKPKILPLELIILRVIFWLMNGA